MGNFHFYGLLGGKVTRSTFHFQNLVTRPVDLGSRGPSVSDTSPKCTD